MVFSLKANKKRILAVLVLIVVVIGGFIIIPKLVTAPMKHYGETATQRQEYLRSFGYDVAEEPIDARNVIVPKEFNDVYTKYNIMQKAQGFDLQPFKGKECKQFIYLINNYPNTQKEIHATLLVYEGVIIGGDVSCAEVDGFMHGFALDSARYGDESAKTESSTESSESTVSSEASSEAQTTGTDVTEPESSSEGESSEAENAGEEGTGETEDAGAEGTGETEDAGVFPTD